MPPTELSTPAWRNPGGALVISVRTWLFGLEAAAYARLDYLAERPPQYISFAEAEPARAAAAGWAREPHAELLGAARREISCWCAHPADAADALRALWPELEAGFCLIPGRPRDRLPPWKAGFGSPPSPALGERNV